MDLNKLRTEINACDDEILALFTKRMQLCKDVAAYKLENNLPVFQRDREDAVLARMRAAAEPELAGGAGALFAQLMDISKCLQQLEMDAFSEDWAVCDALPAGRVGCQGVPGSNSETAAAQLFPAAQPLFFAEFDDVFGAVEKGYVDYGILPVRNSTAGTVAAAYALLRAHPVSVTAATTVAICHCLAAKPDTDPATITSALSHPEALRQCTRFLREKKLTRVAAGNTAIAAQTVSESDEPLAAICSPECAARYGLTVLAQDIADVTPNFTRFFCISRARQYTRDADVVSVLMALPHTEGSLWRTLTKFYACGLDLLHLESRPIADGSFQAVFYLDFRGNLSDPRVRAVLAELKDALPEFRLLGNYRYA